jgi:CheY-like chemotaxis protein
MINDRNYSIPGNKKILLVEDVEMNQFLASKKIESWGVRVDIAQNGKVAVDMMMKEMYDLVLMDIQMPEMDGLEATMHIRNMTDSKKAAVPIVALTANVLKGDGERYIAAGMNGYLSKPFDDQKLFNILCLNLKNGSMSAEPSIVVNHAPVAAASTTGEKLYDLTMVQTISGGDSAFIKKMVQIFLDTIPPSIDQLKDELQKQNWDALSKLAHKMKSTIDSMGIDRLKDVIRTIEANGKQKNDLDSLPAQVMQVDDVLNDCIQQLKRDFSL